MSAYSRSIFNNVLDENTLVKLMIRMQPQNRLQFHRGERRAAWSTLKRHRKAIKKWGRLGRQRRLMRGLVVHV